MKNDTLKTYLIEFPNYISLFILSFFMMLLSPVLLDVSAYFNTSAENMNLITTFFMLGQVPGFLILPFLNKKFNCKNVMIWAYILLIPILTGLVFTASLVYFYVLYFISGLLFGIIFMNSNKSMLEGKVQNKDSVCNIGYSFYAIGALVAPFFASNLVSRQINWKFLYLIIIALVMILLISYLAIIRNKEFMTDIPVGQKNISIKKLFNERNKNIFLILTIILNFLYIMCQTTVFSWAPTFFRSEKFFTIYSAGYIISLFWISVFIGRLVVSYLSYKFKVRTLLNALSIISIIGLILAIFFKSPVINFIGIGLTGLGFSGIPPLLISSIGKTASSNKDIALTIMFIFGATGGGIIPYIIKFIAKYSVFASMTISILLMAIFAVFVIIRRFFKK